MGDIDLPNLFSRIEHSLLSFEHKFKEASLHNHVDQPTRRWGIGQPSTLDLILTNEPTTVEDIQYLAPLGKSDHAVLVFDYICSAERLSKKTKLFRKIQFQSLNISHKDAHTQEIDYMDSGLYYNTLQYISKLSEFED